MTFADLIRAFGIAQIGGHTTVVPITGNTIGVSGAYVSGDTLGTGNPVAIEVFRANNGSGVLQSITLGDLTKQDGLVDVIFFGSNPSATTFTDNAALDIADADLPKIIGTVSIVAADYSDFNDNSVATKVGIGLPLLNTSTTATTKLKLWLAFVSRDTKTYSANELSANIGVLQD